LRQEKGALGKKKTEEEIEVDKAIPKRIKDPMAAIFKTANFVIPPASELNQQENVFWVDTGSYIINALISGSIFKGVPSDIIFAVAGESGTGKTYLALQMCKVFLDKNPTGRVFYYDTEKAIKTFMLTDRGIDTTRFYLVGSKTIESFHVNATRVLKGYMALPEADRPPMLMILDSLGNISTEKERAEADVDVDKQKKDMTKAQKVRGVFRTITQDCAEANVPLIVTNHTYEKTTSGGRPGMPPPKEMNGGEGLKYAASTILFLSKKSIYNEADKTVTGTAMTAKLAKSRVTRHGLSASTVLDFDTGLDRYAGLFEAAKKYGVVTKDGNGFRWPDGTFCYTKHVEDNPEKFFTEENLKVVDEKIQAAFKFGSKITPIVDEDGEPEEEITFNL
jgi:RecA/RadA recombinase